MGIWDDVNNLFSGGGSGAVQSGYNQANQYMSPYQQGGVNNYNQMQNYSNQWGNNLAPYQNAGQQQWNQANQSPTDYYNSIMGSYKQSPQAQYATQQMQNASNNAASASGMLGSGAQQKEVQQNANAISAGDQQQYFNNVMGTNQMQMGDLENLQGQQAQQRNMMQYLTGLGYGAAGQMGQNSINSGLAQSYFDQNSMNNIWNLIGAGSQGFSNSGSGGGGGSSIPAYMQYAAAAGG